MQDEVLERFNLIIGYENNSVDLDRLSSAQKARFISWLQENKFSIPLGSETVEPVTAGTSDAQGAAVSNVESVIGVDIQFVPELFTSKSIDLKSDPEMLRIFSQREIAYAETKSDPNVTLAGIFAAKEAIIKAGYFKNETTDLRNIEISHSENGKPLFLGFTLSISHSKDYAICVACRNDDPFQPKSNKFYNESLHVERTGTGSHLSVENTSKGFSKTATLILIILASGVMSFTNELVMWLITIFD